MGCRGQRGKGDNQRGGDCSGPAKDDGDWAEGWWGRWGEVHDFTFWIRFEDGADRTHCWTTCGKNQEIMMTLGSRPGNSEEGAPTSETPKHCPGSQERMDVEKPCFPGPGGPRAKPFPSMLALAS